MKLSGAEILLESLKMEKVDIIFGYPGGAVLPIFDKLYDAPVKFILTRHEQGAAHAADGYARATGKVGVCLATSGPGATNLVTGIANAYMDSIPMVALTGQVKTFLIGTDYKNLGALRSEMVQTRNRFEQLSKLMENVQNEGDKTELQNQIQTLEQEQTRIESFIKAREGRFSLFGWLVKLFNK